jgi:hypothetical protein
MISFVKIFLRGDFFIMLKNKLISFISIFIIISIISTLCFATDALTTTSVEDINDEVTTTSENEIPENQEVDPTSEAGSLHEDDFYSFWNAEDITINQLVDGNVYVSGNNVTLSGKVGGDMFVMAQTLTLTSESYVYGNLFVIASTINIDGIVCDLYAVGNSLNISPNAIILRDLRSAVRNVKIEGSIGRSTHMSLSNLSISETAHIYRDLNYSAEKAFEVPAGTVDGSINFTEAKITKDNFKVKLSNYVMDLVHKLVYTLAIFGLVLLVAPKFVNKATELTKNKLLLTFGLGLLTLIIVPIIGLVLLISLIAASVSFALLVLYFLVISITFAVTVLTLANIVGEKVKVLGKFNNLLGVVLVTIVLWALQQLPFIGFAVSLITTIYGLGLIVLSVYKKRVKADSKTASSVEE